jgi:hypothetical protein
VRNGIGIDLGLKDFAALSTGEKIENPQHLRQLADKLGTAQRARKRRRATNIYARITNARRDFHHKLSTRIVACVSSRARPAGAQCRKISMSLTPGKATSRTITSAPTIR